MASILFLAHRTPYPPHKGDKIRSWAFLSHLIKDHKVHLGYFEDNKNDAQYRSFLAGQVESLLAVTVNPKQQKIMALKGLLTGDALTLTAYPRQEMQKYIKEVLARQNIDFVFVYSSVMANFVPAKLSLPFIMDMVDVDSAKWSIYADKSSFPLNYLYRREAILLARYEASVLARSTVTSLVSQAESFLFQSRNNIFSRKIITLNNGVDLDHFTPEKLINIQHDRIIFTGVMTYKPNCEAVLWFVRDIFPLIKKKVPKCKLVIAGSPVAREIKALAQNPDIVITGFVDDMTQELGQARVAIVPLMTARGIQNKILEAMAMGLPVVTTSDGAEGLILPRPPKPQKIENSRASIPIRVQDRADKFADAVTELLLDEEKARLEGMKGRAYVKEYYSWKNSLQELDKIINTLLASHEKVL